MPTYPVIHRAKQSNVKITIASVLTKIPGLQNIKINWGEKKSFENSDLDSDYEAPELSGLLGEQSLTADLILDPLSTVHQFLHASWNYVPTDEVVATDKQRLTGTIDLGLTTKTITGCKMFLSKFDTDQSKGAGIMASIEFKFVERITKNES